MGLKDDVIKILRAEDFEGDTLNDLRKEQFKRYIGPKLAALYKRRIRVDDSVRQAAQDALTAEIAARKEAEVKAEARAAADVEKI